MIVFTTQVSAGERVFCTIAWEIGASEPLIAEGECDDQISSASTFKIAIGLMGFDSGVLTSREAPEWPFRAGYIDWRPEWKQPTTPESWMRYSVVWYSQQITQKLGEARFKSYVNALGYGNKDVSGDPGGNNGLTHSWLSSSLKISPFEQVDFLTRMLEGSLPVSPAAVSNTKAIMEQRELPDGWTLHGKTGSGLPVGPDGELLKGQPFGWYVGWAERGGRQVAFARLVRFDERPSRIPGSIARDGLMERLSAPMGPLR